MNFHDHTVQDDSVVTRQKRTHRLEGVNRLSLCNKEGALRLLCLFEGLRILSNIFARCQYFVCRAM